MAALDGVGFGGVKRADKERVESMNDTSEEKPVPIQLVGGTAKKNK